MNWRDELNADERLEVAQEDLALLKLSRVQRKRARDALRMATKRAGKAAIKLPKVEQAKMLPIYLAAQKLSAIHKAHFQVDHITPLHGVHMDKRTGVTIHYICGLHVPQNLRVILGSHNRERSDELYTAAPLIVPDDDIPF